MPYWSQGKKTPLNITEFRWWERTTLTARTRPDPEPGLLTITRPEPDPKSKSATRQALVLVEPENAAFYRQSGLRDLKRALEAPRFEGKAKNVIMFVGDGM